MKDLASDYVQAKGGPLNILVSIYGGFSEIKNLYTPFMDFPGDFGGSKPVKFN